MFTFKTKQEEVSKVDPVIDTLIESMQDGYSTGEFKDQATCLKLLMEAKAAEPKPDRVSANTVANIAGSLGGIIMILIFERTGVITSKSLSFLPRPRA